MSKSNSDRARGCACAAFGAALKRGIDIYRTLRVANGTLTNRETITYK